MDTLANAMGSAILISNPRKTPIGAIAEAVGIHPVIIGVGGVSLLFVAARVSERNRLKVMLNDQLQADILGGYLTEADLAASIAQYIPMMSWSSAEDVWAAAYHDLLSLAQTRKSAEAAQAPAQENPDLSTYLMPALGVGAFFVVSGIFARWLMLKKREGGSA